MGYVALVRHKFSVVGYALCKQMMTFLMQCLFSLRLWLPLSLPPFFSTFSCILCLGPSCVLFMSSFWCSHTLESLSCFNNHSFFNYFNLIFVITVGPFFVFDLFHFDRFYYMGGYCFVLGPWDSDACSYWILYSLLYAQ